MGSHKFYFYDYISAQDLATGFNALIMSVYNSSDEEIYLDFIEYLLNIMKDTFGLESRQFFWFINQRDFNGYSALDYANTPKIRNLLIEFGALPGHIMNAIERKAINYIMGTGIPAPQDFPKLTGRHMINFCGRDYPICPC